MKQVLKWTVPIDDRIHLIGSGRVVHVDSQYGRIDEVQVWTEETEGELAVIQPVKVVGTGHPFPDGQVVGSVVVSHGNLVWHVVTL